MLGTLEWRSIRLEMQHIQNDDFQSRAVVNYAELEKPFTRIQEPKRFHPERKYKDSTGRTVILHEYPVDNPKEPYYPVRTKRNLSLLESYKSLALNEAPQTIFGGRLGQYSYLDMDKTIASALDVAKRIVNATPRVRVTS
jgi:UDP-galactopyranose mutase